MPPPTIVIPSALFPREEPAFSLAGVNSRFVHYAVAFAPAPVGMTRLMEIGLSTL